MIILKTPYEPQVFDMTTLCLQSVVIYLNLQKALGRRKAT